MSVAVSPDVTRPPTWSFFEIAYSDGPRAKVKCYGADDVREGVAIMWKEGVDVSITGNSTNPTRFQHPVAGTYKKERVLAVIVFIALYFVKAGYGMFRTRSWGWSVPNKVGWVLMEAPSFVAMGLWAWKAGVEAYTPQVIFVGLFMLHYFQRSFVFPLLMKGKSRMPLAIMAMGILFNVINATLLAASFFSCALPGMYEPATFWINPLPWVGAAIFFIGMAINLHADHVIRNLRKPGDTRHYLPEKGFYRYVTSANYFGELVEWTGFALLTASPAAWVFVWWTAANLVPRADAIYKRYCEEFGKQAVGSRK